MKRYVPIIIGVVALCAVLYLGSSKMTNDAEIANDEATSSEVTGKSFQGSFTKIFEGENTLQYGFNLPEMATATVSMDGALVKVTESDMPVLAMYVSFEGGRGYTPADYIAKNIMTKVSGVTLLENKTIGKHDWAVAQSANSEWHVASVEGGKWLLVVENKKADSEKAMSILESAAVFSGAPVEETSDADVDSESGLEVVEEGSSTSGK
jgi:hypothetical protein